jgi:hypothetical protein
MTTNHEGKIRSIDGREERRFSSSATPLGHLIPKPRH